jgi:hypothetical protein
VIALVLFAVVLASAVLGSAGGREGHGGGSSHGSGGGMQMNDHTGQGGHASGAKEGQSMAHGAGHGD